MPTRACGASWVDGRRPLWLPLRSGCSWEGACQWEMLCCTRMGVISRRIHKLFNAPVASPGRDQAAHAPPAKRAHAGAAWRGTLHFATGMPLLTPLAL